VVVRFVDISPIDENQCLNFLFIIESINPTTNRGEGVGFGFMVFNATFNNISVISSQSVLLVEETGVPGENHRSVASH
jgi:hypothetical protein